MKDLVLCSAVLLSLVSLVACGSHQEKSQKQVDIAGQVALPEDYPVVVAEVVLSSVGEPSMTLKVYGDFENERYPVPAFFIVAPVETSLGEERQIEVSGVLSATFEELSHSGDMLVSFKLANPMPEVPVAKDHKAWLLSLRSCERLFEVLTLRPSSKGKTIYDERSDASENSKFRKGENSASVEWGSDAAIDPRKALLEKVQLSEQRIHWAEFSIRQRSFTIELSIRGESLNAVLDTTRGIPSAEFPADERERLKWALVDFREMLDAEARRWSLKGE